MQVWLRWVFITLCAMEAILASSLAKVTSTASLAKASGAVSGSVLVGLKSMRESGPGQVGGGLRRQLEMGGAGATGRALLRDLQGQRGWLPHLWPLSPALPCPGHLSWLFLGGGPERGRT